jgi:D-alanyl-lipoteichoic acid acyltransferase DltB (MBOAT superfamily)
MSLSGNLGLLFFFKYFDFLAGLANTLLSKGGAEYQIPLLHLLLPVGISFYTFQTLSYSIDIYRGNLKAERNFWKFALFVTFFPQLVAGPIVRAREFIPALYQKTRHFVLTNVHVANGLFFYTDRPDQEDERGLAGRQYRGPGFTSPQMHSSLEALCGVYAYALQIYGDFSGYTDIAIGSAMILGVQLTDNFNRPYRSGSISEFWRRWHISLGSWFRDYLYIPLGGNRRHVYFNVFMVMFLCGLWHGAGISFVLWGLYHGIFMMIERFTGLDRTPSSGLKRFGRQFVTFHIVLFGWIIFRADNMETFNGVLKAISNSTWTYANISLPIIAFMVTFYAIHFSPLQWKDRAREFWIRTHPVVRGLVAGLITIGLYNIAVSNVKPFIYFQF